jgi:hypothetical protein
MKTLLTATCLLIACATMRAAAPAGYTPKTKSVFTGAGNQHNPFWPIGWVKTEDDSADSAASVNPRPDDFMVTTILLNDPKMAVINGKDMAEGEVAALTTNGGQSVVVQLMDVQDGHVTLRWQNQAIVVPIHRDEELFESAGAPQ